ncbi:hypothetical protein F2P56_036937 [Juglans regia]|uniref:RNase H type-1 domain-containing protein n=2 Tax=Juglans regia TaxID=51240 RepID=A0A833T7T0_JUGRE|nr:uncharacterized protein LOC109006360 [Juglans regia]KAF5442116.1 hypothetical protein F2P56_036937 [Juglans regia]
MLIIMWKAWYGCLPVDGRIRRAGIYMVSKCDFCISRNYEDQNHKLALGNFAEQVWGICSNQLGMPILEGHTWKQMIESWYRRANNSHSGQLIGILPSIITWRLWWRRCKARMEGVHESVQVVWNLIKYWLAIACEKLKESSSFNHRNEEILKVLNLPFKHKKSKPVKIVKWSPPPRDWVKLNVDESSLGNPGPSSAGGVIWDHCRNLISGFSISTGVQSNNVAEFMALLLGLRTVQFFGLKKVKIEMDSMLVIDWLMKKRCGLWYLKDYWEELLNLMDGLWLWVRHIFRV